MTQLPAATVANLFAEQRPFLWGLCYRLTGSAADADDIVQETFVRALEHPPARTDEPWRPWLVRVALNLGRDLLRKRKRRAYVGPWLPSPLETSEKCPELLPGGGESTEGRYELLESISFAFLIALEALTPQQRAVLLLRDVFDYSVQETAEALGISEANVKTSHHRARKAMRSYDQARSIPTRALQERTRHALEQFLTCLFHRNAAALESLLAAEVRLVSDSGGEFLAARKPIVGRERLLRFYLKAMERNRTIARVDIRILNGLPALVMEFADHQPRQARRVVQFCQLDRDGRIQALHVVLASRKLTTVRFSCGGSDDHDANPS